MWLTICSFLLALVSTATAATLYVNTSGSGGAYTSIQDAIDAAWYRDHIEVAPGTYTEAITFWGDKQLHLYSSGGAAITKINGNGADHVVQCMYGVSPATIIEGFTITGGNANGSFSDQKSGGGMYIYWSSGPTVKSCVFNANRADNEGGGMYIWSSSPNLINCTFAANVSVKGGGMYNTHSSPALTGCTFSGNNNSGMYNRNSSPTVTGCTFSSNTGCGMYNYTSSPVVTGCTFTSNSDSGMTSVADSSPNVTNCTFNNNQCVDYGGGMYNGTGSPIIDNCIFSSNTANYGGGMCNRDSSATVTNCSFSSNSAGKTFQHRGGGMYNDGGSVTVTGCRFTSNSANQGGGMYSDQTSLTLTNCTFELNLALDEGWLTFANGQGGGMYIWCSSANVTNCVFRSNVAQATLLMWANGGGLYNAGTASLSPKLTNCTFRGNEAEGIVGDRGGAIYNSSGTITVANCILWGDSPYEISNYGYHTITYSDVQGGWSGTGNLNADPLFRDADGRLSWNSPCIDRGDNSAISGVATDRDGNPRIVDGNFDGNPVVDMGAYEKQTTLYVPAGYGTIQAAINAAVSAYEIEVAPGTYNEAINFLGKAIRLYSSGGPQVTTINGSGAYHVVQCVSSEGSDTILEGFTVTGGNANGGWPNDRGGGMYNQGSSPTVINCIFTSNAATGYGGGMSNNSSSPTVTGCTFEGNLSANHFGGMHNDGASPTVANCTFTGNTADGFGGGIGSTNHCSGTVTDCIFSGNTAGWKGGGMFNVEGSSWTVTNCTFSDNTAADSGGGMYNAESSPTLTNCTFTGNTASLFGGGMYNEATSNPTVTNCTFINNRANKYNGGGMCNNNGSSPNVTNCIFTGNLAAGYGGGIGNIYSTPTVKGCSFNNNSAKGAGGMDNNNSDAIVTDCTFGGNTATDNGGGMGNNTSSPTVTGCTFGGNTAGYGGGMSNQWGSPNVMNCIFSGNSASNSGGGVYSDDSSPTMTNCTFNANTASVDGGGMYNKWNSPNVINCTFSSNGSKWGAGLYNYGSDPLVTNCTFSGNSASSSGGGMLNQHGCSPTLTNCTFSGNTCLVQGGGMCNYQDSAPTVTNCILWGNSAITGSQIYGSPNITYSDVQGVVWPGTGNIDADPTFADADGRLSPGSPCIDAGNNGAVGVTTDLDGNPRIADGDLNGVPVVDMGAYEYAWPDDADADGIKDSVDTAPLVYSNDFAQGSTSGTIVERGDQTVLVADAPDPDGVKIEASASGGPAPAQVSVCGGAAFTLDAGDAVVATCASIDIAVVQGTVEITFVAADGTQAETSLNAGNAIAFEPQTCTITASASNVDNVVVIVNGGEIILAPGESKVVGKVDIDIYPNRTPNQVYRSRNYTLYVVVFGTAEFNVMDLDWTTVRFGRTGTEARAVRAPVLRDMNGDGILDALYGFMTFDCGFQLGDTEGVLTGKTTAGIDLIGRDSVVVSP
jgi:parallel beta-helix repeat protein